MGIIALIRSYLNKQDEILQIYLVGSLTNSLAMPDSDYDLVILTRQALMPYRRTMIERELAALLEADIVVLVPLGHATARRSYAIVVHGRQIFERDLATCIAFEKQIMCHYKDTMYTQSNPTEESEASIHEDIHSRQQEPSGSTQRTWLELRS